MHHDFRMGHNNIYGADDKNDTLTSEQTYFRTFWCENAHYIFLIHVVNITFSFLQLLSDKKYVEEIVAGAAASKFFSIILIDH